MKRVLCRYFQKTMVFSFLIITAFSAGAADLEHIIQSGETVYALARRYGVKPEEILFLNGIEDAAKIRAGQKIRIPAGQTMAEPARGTAAQTKFIDYKAQNGDTLYAIARKFGIKYQTLADANKNIKMLKIGQIVKVPVEKIPAEFAAGQPAETPLPAQLPQAAPLPQAAHLPDGLPADKMAQPANKPGGAKTAAPAAPAVPAAPSAAARPQSSGRVVDQRLVWPVKIKEAAYMTGKLDGVILTSDKSAVVRSISSGTVASAGPYRGFGRVAIIQTDSGYIYVYGGCEALSVRSGERVTAGSELGRLGIDGVSGKPQLFFMVYKGSKAIDPAKAPRA
ncbi:MAG: LysM peptidoglycan-binding domain-containing protein [Spirochaetaceae bacterium]|jgi:murein DD-endopeptidase MepM/ murein hydrolase activator NlpD|nr:LysM peptidoglycan-binding domain-containing protein [Spirochaetaceae bacterium]